jgi:hypothetical protein
MRYWLYNKLTQFGELDEDIVYEINFIPKEYAFLRNWMDIGVDPIDISKFCKYMIKHNINNTYEFDVDNLPSQAKSILKDYDLEDIFNGDNIYIHDIFDDIKYIPNRFELIGGGVDECLAEIKIVFDTINKKYKINTRYIY